MKRAVVWQLVHGWWKVDIEDQYGIRLDGDLFPTHAEALAHAIAEVGLTPTNPKEKA